MKNTLNSFRRGLTMLELVFVIVILGIVASIGSSIIVQVYESYIVQRALHRTSTKAELAAQQIANRLTYRISSSVIGRKPSPNVGVYLPIDQVPDGNYTTLEWIAYDNDSFSSQSTPGWSGFCDVDSSATSRINISTPGSSLDDTDNIIIKLSAGTPAKDISDAAIVFAGHEYNTTKNYIANCMGFTDNSCIYRLNAANPDDISLPINDNGNTLVITEQYKLAWSAYAIVPTVKLTTTELEKRGFQAGDDIYDLTLHYNYQPWATNSASSYVGSPSRILVTNVESFRFIGKGDTIRFKICVVESIGDSTIRSCKEKAVIR